MAFNLFKKKKKEPDYDPLNIKVTDLKKNFVFEYDLRQWSVVAEYTYDWGDNYFSKEFKVTDGKDTFFLSVSEDDEVEIALHKKIRLSAFDEDIEQEIIKNEMPPKKIEYEGAIYTRDSESPGYFKEEEGTTDWVEFMGWDYIDKSGEKLLTIEQWGDREFEASAGKVIKEFEIMNILPA